jgi:chromosome segregation ATPase
MAKHQSRSRTTDHSASSGHQRAPKASPSVLRDEIADLEQLRDKLKGEAAEAATEFHRLRQQKEQLEKELTVARAALDTVDLQRDQAIQAIESEVAAKRRAEEQALEQAQHALEAERQQAADAHRRELARLAQELEATRQVHLEQKCRLKNQFERLCDEVRGKADILRGLELIEQSQYDELLGAIHADHRVGDERND